jgi:hypothetical protein
MNSKLLLIASIALSLAACASNPGGTADSGAAAKAGQPPLLVSEYVFGGTWIYWQNRARYHILEVDDKDKIYNRFIAVHYINRSDQPITSVQFDITAYDNNKPILGADGKPWVMHLVADGPVAPGADRIVKNDNTVWELPANWQFTCGRFSAIRVSYADGSTATLSSPEAVRQAIEPQVDVDCGTRVAYIVGVYPPKNVILGNEQDYLIRQPFTLPSDTVALN